LLKSPVYAGKVRHKEAIYDGEHEGLVEEELFDEVQRIIASNNRRKLLGGNCKTPSLLSGMIIDPQGNPISPKRVKRAARSIATT